MSTIDHTILGVFTIFILNNAIKENASHGDGTTGEVRVVVHAFTNFDTSRGVNVTGEQSKDVIL